MKSSTRDIIRAALRADETVPQEVADAISALLAGKVPQQKEPNLQLVTMAAAARKLGLSRTWFWSKVKREGNTEDASFPTVEIEPGVYRYRLRDLEAFVARNGPYVPRSRAAPRPRTRNRVRPN
jgi:predicted DNA-binding transcriptional regulator AlpA